MHTDPTPAPTSPQSDRCVLLQQPCSRGREWVSGSYLHPTPKPSAGNGKPPEGGYHPSQLPLDGASHPSWLSLPVDTGLGREGPAPASVAWGPPRGRGTPHMVVSSADQGRQSPALVLACGALGSKVPREADRRSLHTDVQEADREQEPPSLIS